MLVLNNFSFEFGSRYLYKDTDWHIKPGQKIGLIGANGTGKSTLLRVINGEYKLSGGNITKRNDLTIGFLNQDLLSYESHDSILIVAMQAFARANKLHEEIEAIVANLDNDHSEDTLHKLHDRQAEYEALDGYNLQYKAEAILEGLGFSSVDLQRPLNEFSGGWRMRVMLAKILLQEPTLLMLDEPTNHLDLPSIEWLEEYLKSYTGAYVIVSHDRYFLDRVVTTIAEVASQQIILYTGNYTDYLEQKALREELQHNQFKNQEKYIKEQEKLIDRFRAKASKAKMAQSRIKMLDKVERLEDVGSDAPKISIRFEVGRQPGIIINEIDVKSKSYPKTGELMHATKASIERGDKIALIGANGKGKSTLLRMLMGVEKFEGALKPGHNVDPAFFAQHQLESLHLNNTLLEELQHTAPELSDTYLRSLLGAFLFRGDDVFKKIKVLSGGEKSRVALAKTVLSKANFLLLDEPTNHLDMHSVGILIQVLQDFDGSFVVVSHDRFFVEQVANKIWFIENKEIKEYPGTYHEYEDWAAKRKADQKAAASAEVKKPKTIVAAEKQPVGDKDAKKKELKKLQTQYKTIEEQLEKLKTDKAALESVLADPSVYSDPDKMKDATERYKALDKELLEANGRWEELFMQVSELEEALK